MSKSKVNDVKLRMLEVDVFADRSGIDWFEGYVCALTDENIISEDELEDLIEWRQSVLIAIYSSESIRTTRKRLMEELSLRTYLRRDNAS